MEADENIDYCEECKAIIGQEDYITEFEDRGEFWGAQCKEEIVIGYKCPVCGHKGMF